MSASDISIRFAAEGDQTLRTALSAIDAQLKALNEGVKASSEAMKGLSDTEEATAQKNELLARSIEANREKIAILARQYDEAKEKLSDLGRAMEEAKQSGDPAAIDRATNAYNRQAAEVARLEQGMSRAQGEISRAQNEMAGAEQKSESLSEKIGRLADAMQLKLAKEALGGVVSGLEAFGAKCAEVGQKIWGMASEASTMADDMITLATKTGISTDKLQEYAYAARFVDTEVSTITGSMVKLTRSMSSTSEATQDAFARLGVSVTDSKGRMRDAETVFWEAIDALGKVRNETERDQIAMALFGKSAQDLNPLIKAGSAEWQRYAQEARDAGLVISKDGIGALGGFNDALQRVDASMSSAKNQLMAALAPALSVVADAVAKAAQQFTVWMQSLEGQQVLSQVTQLITDLAGRVTGNLGPAVSAVIDTFKNVGDAVRFLSENMNQILSVITAVAAVFITLKTAMAALQIATLVTNPVGLAITAIAALAAGVVLLIQNWDKVKAAGAAAWETIKNAWNAAGEWFRGVASAVLNAFTGIGDRIGGFFRGAWETVRAAWSGVTSFFQGIIDAIRQRFGTVGQIITVPFESALNGVKAVWNTVGAYFTAVWNTIKGVFSVVESVFKGNFQGAWNAIKGIVGTWKAYFQTVWSGIKSVFDPVANIFTSIFSSAWNGIKNAWSGVTSYFSGVKENIVNAFSALPSRFMSLGQNLVRGLWEGIQNMMGWITGKVKGFTDSVVGAFKDFFGIKSPSTVMRDQVGEYIGEGIAVGIKDSQKYIQGAVNSVMPDLSGLSAGITVTGMTEPAAQQPIFLQVDGHTFARLMTGYIDEEQGSRWTEAMALA